jgi:hypothetical protein
MEQHYAINDDMGLFCSLNKTLLGHPLLLQTTNLFDLDQLAKLSN